MNTPYQTPNSQLEGDFSVIAPRRFWKWFFWFLLIVELLSIGLMISDGDPIAEILLDVTIYTFVLIGLFGFAYRKRIIARAVWQLTIPIALTYDIYSLVSADLEEIESTAELVFISSISFAILAPMIAAQYIGLFKYAYRSSDIWERYI